MSGQPVPKQGRKRSNKRPSNDWRLDDAQEFVRTRSGGFCEADTPGCLEWRHLAEVVHHKRGRRGRDPHHPSKLLHLCASGHAWVHANPKAAMAAGWMESRLGASSVLTGEQENEK